MITVGIMQPYFLPYLGYFHLIKSVDIFVIYDDVQYVRGWINRNRFIFNDKIEYVTLPLINGSRSLLISDREISKEWDKEKIRVSNCIKQFYKKRINFSRGIKLCNEIFNYSETNLLNFVYHSILKICKELEISTKIIRSSSLGDFRLFKGEKKIIEICKSLNADRYINVFAGEKLYNRNEFKVNGLDIKFIKSSFDPYNQSNSTFVPELSVIDMIFSISSRDEMQKQINNFEFV